jgi:HTH-type transcriptional regulator/antitoxin HigA
MSKLLNAEDQIPGMATHPGEILKDELDARGISQSDFAKHIGIQRSQLNEILKGKRGVNADLALLLEEALKIDAEYWLNAQKMFELDEARITKKNQYRLEALEKWNMVQEYIPVSYFKKHAVITGDPVVDVEKVKEIYAVSHLEDIAGQYATARFRKSETLNTDKVNLLGWDKLVRYLAKDIRVSRFNQSKREDLIAELNMIFYKNKAVLSRIENSLIEYGIKCVFQEKASRTPLDGACFWSEGHPAIALTLRHKRVDNLAFSLFHELGHVFLHLVNNSEAEFIDIDKAQVQAKSKVEEKEADSFANSHLIPDSEWQSFYKSSSRYTDADIRKFSKTIKVNPAIVRGRICHLNNDYSGRTGISYAIG